MPVPASQNFDAITGPLGAGSVTINGVTLYSDDPNGVITVTPQHRLSFNTGPGTHVVGYKSADGSNFSASGGNGLGSFSVYSAGSYTVQLLRDGDVVAGSGFTSSGPSFYDVTVLSRNIDEIRFTYSGASLVLDDLNFSAPQRPFNAAPQLSGIGGDLARFVEGGAPILIDVGADARITDDMSDQFANATLRLAISENFAPGEDRLGLLTTGAVALSSGLTVGSTVSVDGVAIGVVSEAPSANVIEFTFNANADAAGIQALLRAVTYQNVNDFDPQPGARRIEIQLFDGEGAVAQASVYVEVAAAPDLPNARDDVVFVTRGAVASLALEALTENDTNPTGRMASVDHVSTAQAGDVTFRPGGLALTYVAPLSGGSDSFSYYSTVGDGLDAGRVNVNLLNATAGADVIRANTAAEQLSWLDGLAGNDALSGGAGQDTLIGGTGDDRLNGLGGADDLRGGPGDDIFYVDDGRDVVRESIGDGRDMVLTTASFTLGSGQEVEELRAAAAVTADLRLTGNAFANLVRGGAGDDALDGRAGADRLLGAQGDDTYYVDEAGDIVSELAGAGVDRVVAGVSYTLTSHVEQLTLIGSASSGTGNGAGNTISGNDLANTLGGLAGNDYLRGMGGDDILRGGVGQDRTFGGGGGDVFLFDDGEFGGSTNATADYILDFEQGFDRIDLQPVDARSALGGDQAFAFIGTEAFTAAGQIRYEQVGGDTYVLGSTDADLFRIRLNGLHMLAEADFVL